jgi:hypothetical protein
MKKMLIVLAVALVARTVCASTTLDAGCGSRVLISDFTYPPMNLVARSTLTYYANTCNIDASIQRGAWSVVGSVEYGKLTSGALAQTYMSGNGDSYQAHRFSESASLAALDIQRSLVPSWVSAGAGVTAETWSHNNVHETYLAPHLTVGIRHTIAKRLEVSASMSASAAHRTQRIAFNQPTYIINNTSGDQRWGAGIGMTAKARYAITHHLGVEGQWQHQDFRMSGAETFRSSAVRVGLSFRL